MDVTPKHVQNLSLDAACKTGAGLINGNWRKDSMFNDDSKRTSEFT